MIWLEKRHLQVVNKLSAMMKDASFVVIVVIFRLFVVFSNIYLSTSVLLVP